MCEYLIRKLLTVEHFVPTVFVQNLYFKDLFFVPITLAAWRVISADMKITKLLLITNEEKTTKPNKQQGHNSKQLAVKL